MAQQPPRLAPRADASALSCANAKRLHPTGPRSSRRRDLQGDRISDYIRAQIDAAPRSTMSSARSSPASSARRGGVAGRLPAPDFMAEMVEATLGPPSGAMEDAGDFDDHNAGAA